MTQSFSIVIPIWNEPYIETLIQNINSVLLNYNKDLSYEIILVDKGDTIFSEAPENTKYYKQTSEGLGNAILEGVANATGDVIVTMDGDGSHQPEELPKMFEVSLKNDIVVGSKFAKQGKTDDALIRQFLSRMSSGVANILLRLPVSDCMSGFSAIKRQLYLDTELNPSGFKIVTEMLVKNKNKKIAEIPICFVKRKAGTSKFGVREFFRTGLFVVKLWWLYD